MTNRKHFPAQIIRKKKELQRGESVYVASENLSAVTWMDRKSPLTVDETKAFFAVRLSMEYAVIRPRQ